MPAPVAVRIFQLTATAKFERADVFALIDREQQTLGADDAGSQEFVLAPSETRTVKLEPKPGVSAIGIAALYRDIDHAQWRADAPVAASGPNQSGGGHWRPGGDAEGGPVRPPHPAGTIAMANTERGRAPAPVEGDESMSWTNRVVWQEGMFLRTQHFQQQDRWTEQFVRGWVTGAAAASLGHDRICGQPRSAGHRPFRAGHRRSGVFEDGTPFALPGEADHPPPLDLPDNARNVLVFLALPIRQDGAVEVGDDATPGRYLAHRVRGVRHPVRLAAAGGTAGRAGSACATCWRPRSAPDTCASALARITEVTADRRVILDERWIPPALVCSAALPLSGLVTELAGMLNQRGEALAARMTAPGQAGVAQVADFLLLQSVNGWQNVLAHWADAGNVHPEALYTTLVQMAGEFATFLETRRPTKYPGLSPRRPAAQFCPGGRRPAPRAVGGAGTDRHPDPAARAAPWRAGRSDQRPLDPAGIEFRADGAVRHANRNAAARRSRHR